MDVEPLSGCCNKDGKVALRFNDLTIFAFGLLEGQVSGQSGRDILKTELQTFNESGRRQQIVRTMVLDFTRHRIAVNFTFATTVAERVITLLVNDSVVDEDIPCPSLTLDLRDNLAAVGAQFHIRQDGIRGGGTAIYSLLMPQATQPTTSNPTQQPSTQSPTALPTAVPLVQTSSPTEAPSQLLTGTPTSSPVTPPTATPTAPPSQPPTVDPTIAPSQAPSKTPTHQPSETPSGSPTALLTTAPSQLPTLTPTVAPSRVPTESSTRQPSVAPTSIPTTLPTERLSTESPQGKGGSLVIIVVVVVLLTLGSLLAFCAYKRHRQLKEAPRRPESFTPTMYTNEVFIARNVQTSNNESLAPTFHDSAVRATDTVRPPLQSGSNSPRVSIAQDGYVYNVPLVIDGGDYDSPIPRRSVGAVGTSRLLDIDNYVANSDGKTEPEDTVKVATSDGTIYNVPMGSTESAIKSPQVVLDDGDYVQQLSRSSNSRRISVQSDGYVTVVDHAYEYEDTA